MTMTQIRYILAIVKEGSMNKAAKSLYISQPNLSSAIRQLERELGFPLFERTGSGMHLTRSGQEVYNIALSAYKQFELLNQFCSSLNRTMPARLTVAAQFLEYANQQFIQICSELTSSNYHYSFLEGSFSDVIDLVSSHNADLGIVVMTLHHRALFMSFFKQKELIYHPISQNQLGIMVSSSHPLCQKPYHGLSESELSDFPLVTHYESNYVVSSIFNNSDRSDPLRTITVNDFSTLYGVLKNTTAYTTNIYSDSVRRSMEQSGRFRIFPFLSDNADIEIGYLCSKDYIPSPIATQYLDGLGATLTNLNFVSGPGCCF